MMVSHAYGFHDDGFHDKSESSLYTTPVGGCGGEALWWQAPLTAPAWATAIPLPSYFKKHHGPLYAKLT
jgi:hypothetical protein